MEQFLSQLPQRFRRMRVPTSVRQEAAKRVLDSLGCWMGAFSLKPVRLLRDTLSQNVSGPIPIWGTQKSAPADLAAWINGTAIRALDFNDTYLSKEPCHPSDLISSIWAACELSKSQHQGRDLIHAIILGYDVLCRLCDGQSIRKRGWDHVTYLPIASAVACSYVFKLSPEKTRNAIALSITGQIALRQTRVGTISDWKAACAAYAARAGLWAAQLANAGVSGPHDIFVGRHGFFNQVSGRFSIKTAGLGKPWRIQTTHTKFFPAEHHSQSAIEAALKIRPQLIRKNIKKIVIETFDVATDIIGSEPEKWRPTTRETADHSLPYLVGVALLDGNVTLEQYRKKRFLKPDIRTLLKRTSVKTSQRYSRLYPKKMPNKIVVHEYGGTTLKQEVLVPKGYAGNPMSWGDVKNKFNGMSQKILTPFESRKLIGHIQNIERRKRLAGLLNKKFW